MMDRTRAACCILLAFSLLSTTAAMRPAEADTLRIGAQGRLESLDPHVLNETFSIGVLSNVMEGLVSRDAKLRLRPGLATSWHRLTPLHWRFHLRRGVRFHDGSPFTADDVVFTFARVLHPRSQQKSRVPDGTIVKKVDSHTIDFLLTKPNPILPANWESLLIMSAEWAKQNGLEEPGAPRTRSEALPAVRPASTKARWNTPDSTNLIANGTGPYRITEHRPGIIARFAANTAWWGVPARPPYFERVDLYTVATNHTRTAALLAGQVDLVMPVPAVDLEHIEQQPSLRSVTGPELRTIFLNMDQRRETLIDDPIGTPNPLRDPRVRAAINHAIDAKAIVRVIMRGRAKVAHSLVSPIVHPGVSRIERRSFDPAKARALLQEAGYQNGFTLPMDCPADRYVNDGAICEAVAGMLARIGIRVPLNIQTKSLFFTKVLSGSGYRSSFNLIGWTPGSVDAHDVLSNIARCRDSEGNGARFNLGGYCNPQVNKLTAAALVEADTSRRTQMITEAFELIHNDAGFVPLHQQTLAWAMSNNLDATVRADNQLRFDLIRRRPRTHAEAVEPGQAKR